MTQFEIVGNKKLGGRIKVAGNKNSVLPIMAACLLTKDECTLENVPLISDVGVMAQILKLFNVEVTGVGSDTLKIQAKDIKNATIPRDLTEKLRASVLLLGPLLAIFGKVKMAYPGGDVIGRRPLDAHFQCIKALGGTIRQENDYLEITAKNLKSTEIFLEEASVTATENAIMIATTLGGKTSIKRAASEPHVQDLCNFLVKMGAKIDGIGTNTLNVHGTGVLNGTNHQIRPDHIEAGTFAILGAFAAKSLEIAPIVGEDLDMTLLTLKKFNVTYKINGSTLTVSKSDIVATEKVVTDIWPGFPTDLMAPLIVLATQAKGVTILHDWMYESRMFFVDKLLSMGAKAEIADPHRVFVSGPSKLHGQRLDTPDIRAGMALVIAAIIAEGKSTIDKAHLIERGYENLVFRLNSIGASVKRNETHSLNSAH